MAAAATERQQEVLALIDQDKTVAEMAKALGLTENGVRSHIKRLKQRGLVPKSYGSRSRAGARRRSNGRRTTPAANRTTAVATSRNGSGSFKLDGIPAIEEASKQMAARLTDLSSERDSIDARAEELAAEQAVLRDRKIAVEGDMDRLKRVEEALAGAVA